jgi:hypothetical protein
MDYTDSNYVSTFLDSFRALGPVVLEVASRLVIALAIFIVGWIVGIFLAGIIEKLFKKLNVDNALRKVGVESALRKGGVTLNSGYFVGALVKWFIIVVFLVSSFEVLGFTQVTLFLTQIVSLLPQVIIGVLILLVAAVVGDVVQGIVRASTAAVGVKASHLLGAIAKWSIWIFALLTVLVQIGIAANIIQILFTGIVVACAIAFGLAFGLGGQAHASQLIETIKREISDDARK